MGFSDDEDVHQCGRCKRVFHSIDDYFAHKKSDDVCEKATEPASLAGSEDTRRDDEPPAAAATGPPVASSPAPAPAPLRRRRGRPRKAPKTAGSSEVTGVTINPQAPTQEDDLPIGRRVHSKRRRSAPKKLWQDSDGEAEHGKTEEASGKADEEEDEEMPPLKRQRRGRRRKSTRSRKERSGGAASRDYACPKCDFTECDKDQFDRHLRREHNLTMYVCAGCKAPFRDKYKLKRHTDQCAAAKAKSPDDHVIFGTYASAKDPDDASMDNPEEDATEAAVTSSVTFRCNECSYKAQTYDEIRQHLNQHPDKHPGICRFCGKWFASRYKLWRHMTSSVHDRVSEEAMQRAQAELRSRKISWPVSENRKRGGAGGMTCDACAAVFRTKAQLERHARDAHAPDRVRRFRCGMCKSRFTKRRFLNDHLRGVHDMKGLDLVSHFRCPVCSRVFSQKGHMYRHHETLHTPVPQKPYAPRSSQRAIATSQEEPPEAETTGDMRMNDGTCFARKDGVIVALGEKWVTVEATVWGDEGTTEGTTDGVDGDVHACFVCCRHLETRDSYLRHIEQHRVWVPLPDGPRPANLFDTTASVKLPTLDKTTDVPGKKQTDGADTNAAASADISTSPEAADIVTVNFTIQPEMLTTINRSALIDMMLERDDGSGLRRALAATPSGDATEQAEKEKTLEAAAAIVDLSERAARLGAGAVVPTASSPDDDDVSAGAARLSRGAPETDRAPEDSSVSPSAGECADVDETSTQQCPYCGQTTRGLEAMHAHKVAEHRIEAVFRCVQTTCDRTFDDVAAYREHSRVHSQLAFICTVCNAHFDDFCEILAHKSAVHRHTADGQRRRRCLVCNACFFGGGNAGGSARGSATDRHDYCAECSKIVAGSAQEPAGTSSGVATAVNTLLCDQCGITCESRESLKRHMRAHLVSRVHRCAQCSASFNKGEHLRRHMITKHSDERPFACKFPGCAKSFKRRDKLQEHHMAHSKVRPYVCRICARAYRYREGLRYHEKTHSRESKYHCDTCGRSFVRPGLLQEHARAFHDDTRRATHVYACDVCNAKFPRPERVKRHMEKEHQLVVAWKVYCPHCNMGFPGEHSRRSHVQRQHPVVEEVTSDAADDRQPTLTPSTRAKTPSDATHGSHEQTFSGIVDPMTLTHEAPVSSGHADQNVRVHVIEPLVKAPAPYAIVTSAPAAASLPSLTTLQPMLMTQSDVGHGPLEVESATRNDQDRPVVAGQQVDVTGTGQLVHVMGGDAMTVPMLVQGLPNEVPSGMLTLPLQQLPLVGMRTMDSTHLQGGTIPVAWQLGHVTSEMQRADTENGAWPAGGPCDVERQLAIASNQPPSSQTGTTPYSQPMPVQQIIVLNQPTQNAVTVLNKSLPNQPVFAVPQNVSSQPHQALIAALNQPPQNHDTTPQLQLSSLVEPTHSQTNMEAVNIMQSTSIDNTPTPHPPNTALHPTVQQQTFSVSQMFQSHPAVPSLVQPALGRSVSAAFSQALQSPPRMSAVPQPTQTYGTVIASSQPSQHQAGQYGLISLNQVPLSQLLLAPLDQSALNQSQLPAVSALNQPLYNQPLSQTGMSAYTSGTQTLNQTGMPVSQSGPQILQILNHVGMSTSYSVPQTLGQVTMSASQNVSQTLGQVAMSASQNVPQTLAQVTMSAAQNVPQTLGQVAMSASQNVPQTLGQVAMSASQNVPQTLGQVPMSAAHSVPQTLGQVAMSAAQNVPQTLGQVAMSAAQNVPQTLGQVTMSASHSVPQTLSQVAMSAAQNVPQTLGQVTMSASHSVPQTLGQVAMSASHSGPQTLGQVAMSAAQNIPQTLGQVVMSASQNAPLTLSHVTMSASKNGPLTLGQTGMSVAPSGPQILQILNHVGVPVSQNGQQILRQLGTSASHSVPQILGQVGVTSQSAQQTPETGPLTQVGIPVPTLGQASSAQSGPQTLSQVELSTLQRGNQTLGQIRNSASHTGSSILGQVGMSAPKSCPQTLDPVGMSAQTPGLVGVSASQNGPPILGQVGMSASYTVPHILNQVAMSAPQSDTQGLTQVASKGGPQALGQIGMSASQSEPQTLGQIGMSVAQSAPHTLIPMEQPAPQGSVQVLTKGTLSASQSGPPTLHQVGMSVLQCAAQTVNQGGLSVSQSQGQMGMSPPQSGLPMLTQVSMAASQSGSQTLRPVGMSVSQSVPQLLPPVRTSTTKDEPQTSGLVGMSSLQSRSCAPSHVGMATLQSGPQTSSQLGMSALQSGPQTLGQVGIAAQTISVVNRPCVAVVNPHTVALQSIVSRPGQSPCVAPICSARSLASTPRLVHYPAPAGHSSMPAALSFTSQTSPKTPASSGGKPPLAEVTRQEVGVNAPSIAITRPQQSTPAQNYRSGAPPSSGHIVTTLAYAATPSVAGTPVTQYNSAVTLPHAVHATSHSDSARLPNSIPQPPLPTGTTQPWWPPFNVPQTTLPKADRHAPSTPMLAVPPLPAQSEMDDHMSRLSQVLSILTETSGVQQALSGQTSPTLVSPSSRCMIHSDQTTGDDLVTPALSLRGQTCSTNLESSTSVLDANTPRSGMPLEIPCRTAAASECPQSSGVVDRATPTSCYGVGPTAAPTGAVDAVSTTTSANDTASLLSGSPKDASGHVVLPAVPLLPNELQFQNIPGYEAYSNF